MGQSDLGWSILDKVVNWTVPFIIVLLFRKRIGHALIRAKKWLFNDILTIGLLAVRVYANAPIAELNHATYERARAGIPSLKLMDIFGDELIVSVPVFGRLRLRVEQVSEGKSTNEELELGEEVKFTLRTENPVRLGVRELKQVYNFALYAETLFNSVATTVFRELHTEVSNYAVCNMPRIARFTDEKTFRKEDEELGAIIHGDNDKLEITVSPINKIAPTIEKYRFS